MLSEAQLQLYRRMSIEERWKFTEELMTVPENIEIYSMHPGRTVLPGIDAAIPTRESSECPSDMPATFSRGCPSGERGILPRSARLASCRQESVTAEVPQSFLPSPPVVPDVPRAILWTPGGGSGRQRLLEILGSPGQRQGRCLVPGKPVHRRELHDSDGGRMRGIEPDHLDSFPRAPGMQSLRHRRVGE